MNAANAPVGLSDWSSFLGAPKVCKYREENKRYVATLTPSQLVSHNAACEAWGEFLRAEIDAECDGDSDSDEGVS